MEENLTYINKYGILSYLGSIVSMAIDRINAAGHITVGNIYNAAGYTLGSKTALWQAAENTDLALKDSVIKGFDTLLFGSREESQRVFGQIALNLGLGFGGARLLSLGRVGRAPTVYGSRLDVSSNLNTTRRDDWV